MGNWDYTDFNVVVCSFLCFVIVVPVAAVLVVIQIGFWQSVPLPFIGNIEIGLFGIPLTLIWIVGLTNAYNFMDGIDGIHGIHGISPKLQIPWIPSIP